MSGPQRIMILISQLDHRTSELSEVFIYKVSQLVTCQHGLLLEDAHITPGIDYVGLNIPISRITQKIGVIMKETCRTDYLSVACSLDIHHLS